MAGPSLACGSPRAANPPADVGPRDRRLAAFLRLRFRFAALTMGENRHA